MVAAEADDEVGVAPHDVAVRVEVHHVVPRELAKDAAELAARAPAPVARSTMSPPKARAVVKSGPSTSLKACL